MNRIGWLVMFAIVAVAQQSRAVIVDFTGGTVTHLDSSTSITTNTLDYPNVDYYEENGFRLDFIPNSGSAGFATHVGSYYQPGNDVIHSHWATGNFGGVTAVEITKIAGGPFNLNYFVLTSNTQIGGGAATGLEQAFVEGFLSNVSTGPPVLLPSENWGFPSTPIFLGPAFDGVDKVVVSVANAVDCFGMDQFYLDQEFVPEPSALTIGAMLGAMYVSASGRRRTKTDRR
jgi:hypothetical protein